jgi:hypothetical protein
MQGDYSKYSLRMNIFYRNVSHVTTNSTNCHLMKLWSQGESAEIYDVQSSKNDKILRAGKNGACNMEIYTAVTNLGL